MGERKVERRAVFLDRDGVLNHPVLRGGKPYPPASADELRLYDDVGEGCERLKAADFLLVVATNQPDVGRGTQERAQVEAIHDKLRAALPLLDRIEICYHGGEAYSDACDCRKPKAGMLRRVAEEWAIDLGASYLIGDRWRDVDCARAAGCVAIFVERGYDETLRELPDYTVATFAEAVDVILRQSSIQLHSPCQAPLA